MRSAVFIAATVMALVVAPHARAQEAGDAEAGKKVFNKCKACHAVGEGAKNKIGPELNGIVGEAPASVPDYQFSNGLKTYAQSHPKWTAAELTPWLQNPKAVVPDTKMAFPGLKKPEEIANVIAYLASFDENGKPQDPAAALAAAGQ
ncbi:c-type cytochrome [Mangrovicella endophytica]|uniref:c-type cytochrome n=1 Tax=Mangrovicella endophytica TaxID=2066697 RepID=UPI000C9E8E38|nr:cytochrome c family protein [Mangrovicella endophytica]